MTISKRPDWPPQYHTVKECFDACGDDDAPQNFETGFNTAPELSKKTLIKENLYPNYKTILSDKWQIKRAEPKVLTSHQAAENRDSDSANKMTKIENAFYRTGFEEGDQNGQLREWLRPEQVELREAVERLIETSNDTCGPIYLELEKALENLKPPYKSSLNN